MSEITGHTVLSSFVGNDSGRSKWLENAACKKILTKEMTLNVLMMLPYIPQSIVISLKMTRRRFSHTGYFLFYICKTREPLDVEGYEVRGRVYVDMYG